jgi:SNF2-related domain
VIDTFDARIKAKFANVQRGPEAMHLYQSETAVPFIRKHSFGLICIDMGLGKTVSSLTVISDLVSSFETEIVLVVAPLRVATDTWPTEIAAWRHTAWLSHTLIRVDECDPRLALARRRDRANKASRDFDRDLLKARGLTEAEAQKQLGPTFETQERHKIMGELARTRSSIHIINREQLEWLVYFWKENWPYRTVFIDESSSFKDHSSDRFKALAKVRRTDGLIERLYCLTATPAAETYEHLWSQVYLLDLGQRLGKNITRYREHYFTYNKWSMKWKLREGAESDILTKIADISLVMKARDHLQRSEPCVRCRTVKLEPSHLQLIQQLERDFLIKMPDGAEIEAKTAANLSSMLLQMASGSLYETVRVEDWDTDDLKKVKKVHHIHDHKIDSLKELYEEAQTQGETLLVAYYFKSSLAKLKKAFPKAVVMDDSGKCIKPWNAGKIPMLLIHPQSAGHGLNLQHGGHILVFYDLIYSLEYYLQTIGRIDRQGQKNPVIVQLLVAEGTRDEDVFECLIDKQDAQEKLFRILKRLIRKLKSRLPTVEVEEI